MIIFVTEELRPVIPTSGMLTVAVQLYWPPSDVASGENVYSTELSLLTDTTFDLGDAIFIFGCTTSPATTVAEQFIV